MSVTNLHDIGSLWPACTRYCQFVRAARCDNATAVLMFCCRFFLSFSVFYSVRDLRDLSADRRETLPHDQKWVLF